MGEPHENGFDCDGGDWITCWQCGGDGLLDDCFEDTCVCLDPPCLETRCDVCRGKGGWEPAPPLTARPGEGGPALTLDTPNSGGSDE